ncbi:MAG: GNAT family N-acetyltransferase [Desulfamplus sp.]|nr:GNAT family N-acetyltransferase [Desulfamplus sp.]
MKTFVIRDAVLEDFETICSLNHAEVEYTSPMDLARLKFLHSLSGYHRVGCVNGQIAAFLLAMHSNSPYENKNFKWFACKYTRFMYVDRIVVSAEFRGMHAGVMLYEDLFRYARHVGIPIITCEYNIVPKNEPSRLFHDKLGFKEQGTQWVANGSKLVSLQTVET